jgi:hypothetical protein
MLMKKALLMGIALCLVVALAAPAMAIDWSARGGFTVKNAVYKNIDYRMPFGMGGVPGSWRAIGVTQNNDPNKLSFSGIAYDDPAWNETNWWVQMRGDIFIYARASADLYGCFGIEVNSMRWGDSSATSTPYIGTQGLGAFQAGRWNADAIAIQVKTMFIDFKVPMIPVWIRAGIQPFMIRPVTFLYLDAAGITARSRFSIGDATVQANLFWAKIKQQISTLEVVNIPATGPTYYTDHTTADDGNLFGIDVSAAIGTLTPGVVFAMEHWGQCYLGSSSGGADPVAGGMGDKQYWWISPYVTAKFGPVDLTVDYVYSGGYDKWKYGVPIFSDFGASFHPYFGALPYYLGSNPMQGRYSRRHEGMVARAEASMSAGKFTFGVGGLYGSGDDYNTPDVYEGYVVPHYSEAAFFNKDFLVLMGDWGLRQPYGAQSVGGFFKPWSNVGAGVWYVRAFADFAATDWLTLKGNFGYIGDTVTGHIHSPFWMFGAPSIGGDQFGSDTEDDDEIGWEIDFGVQIDIYKNLSLDTAFGYLIIGKAASSQYGGFRAQDPWALMTALAYTF